METDASHGGQLCGKMASYPISIAIEADLDALVPLMIESYSTNAMDCARFPRPATEANIAWRRKTLGMSLVHDPRAQCLKITDGDRIIAFAMWLAPKSALTPEQQLKLDDYAKMTLGIPEENAANLELYQRMQGMAKGRVMETWPEGHVEVWCKSVHVNFNVLKSDHDSSGAIVCRSRVQAARFGKEADPTWHCQGRRGSGCCKALCCACWSADVCQCWVPGGQQC